MNSINLKFHKLFNLFFRLAASGVEEMVNCARAVRDQTHTLCVALRCHVLISGFALCVYD